MTCKMEMKVIARIRTDFPQKFGVPRQSGLVAAQGMIVFEPEFANPDALRGIEQYSHLWLIWQFSQAVREKWHPTVRPPRLGGNQRVGVFATRSPFRPNAVGLSCVKLEKVVIDSDKGPIIWISGADMIDGTPIFDIKPYLPYTDAHPEAAGGFAHEKKDERLDVDFPEVFLEKVPVQQRSILYELLSQDPRPSYQNDPQRIYGMTYAGMEVKFRVENQTVYVCDITYKISEYPC